ncbi:efflux RND transporter permease subunit [Microbulbifer hydrolyticus]|uniref:AcrB/AcrD/AcrF family protein n=1 Tax=Microbulbifer hydrolyticus TaxID=48074 RepID=A0A6P1T9G9_9GAMM|nr:efflux RND transporter permease subunit [Microbulbifer hydrolyticus]MBB5212911.1 multidrug efflux pump [Microbulbifer hydrolyticus]QHQ38303.1 AcrB/AcrD/AcrF family protein [Microbulbifer hydrolyticus]
MKLLDSAVDRFRSSISLMLLIVIMGIAARGAMTVESSPEVSPPIVIVQVRHEGISPEDGVRLLVRPLEQEIRALEGVEEVIANAREGLVYLVIEFDSAVDIDIAVDDVRNAVDRAKAELPRDADEPIVEEASAQPFPAIVVTLAGEGMGEREMLRSAQLLKRKIENISEVLSAEINGNREEVVEAIIDPVRLEHYQITSGELINAVLGNNLLIPAGEMDVSKGRFSVKVPGLIETAADVYQIPLKQSEHGVVTLGQVTDIRRTFKDATSYTSVNGRPGLAINVEKRTGVSSVDLADTVRAVVIAEREYLPRGVQVDFVFDTSQMARDMVSEMEGNILTAMLLVMIIVVAALGFRSGLLVGFGIPFSLLFGCIITWYLGYSFNFMVMFGMLLALGMLIDGSIVITEFADRKMAEGLSARVAYSIAVRRMFWPVMASTGTTLAAFLPIIFWPGVVGEFMRYLPVTVFSVLAGSLVYALFFAPVLGSVFGKSNMGLQDQQYLKQLESGDPTGLAGVTGVYARMLDPVVRHPFLSFAATILVLIGIFVAFNKFNPGVEFFTETEEQYGNVEVRAQGNLSIEEKKVLVAQVEQALMQVPEVRVVYSAIGSGGISGNSEKSPDQIANLLVELLPSMERERKSGAIFADIRRRTANFAGIKITANEFEGGPPIGKDIVLELRSRDYAPLLAETKRLHQALEGEFDGLRDVVNTAPLPGIEWEVKVDRAKAALYGADLTGVGRAVQLVTNGVLMAEYRPDDSDEEVDIRIRYPDYVRGITALDELKVNTPGGAVPVSSFVTTVPGPKVDKIERIDGITRMQVKADVEDGVLADDKVREIRQWLADHPMDDRVELLFRGADEDQNESLVFLQVAFSLSLFLMFILLVTQFNSFYQSALILSSVIMSTAGVMLGLTLTQSTFSVIMTGVGIVALAGIVVNNNIVLIDTYNYVRKAEPEMSHGAAAVKAAAQRLRPVFLTTATTILGLLPLALGASVDMLGRTVVVNGVIASFWVKLASAIVYGLTFSTLLTLIVTPVMLALPSAVRDWVRQIVPGRDRTAGES